MEVLSGTPDKMAMVAQASQIHFLVVSDHNQFRVYPDMRVVFLLHTVIQREDSENEQCRLYQ